MSFVLVRVNDRDVRVGVKGGRVKEALFATLLFLERDCEKYKDKAVIEYELDETGKIGGEEVKYNAGDLAISIARMGGWILNIKLENQEEST